MPLPVPSAESSPPVVRWQDLATAGRAARERGERALALQHFRHALALQPGHKGLPVDAATELRALGRLDEAEQVLQALLAREPQALNARSGLGYGARLRGQREQALAWFEQELALQPGHKHLPVDIATELRALGRLDESDRVLQALLEREPQAAGARTALGYTARRRGQHAQALDWFEQELALQPAQHRALLDVALELRSLGRDAEAEARLQALLAPAPGGPDIAPTLQAEARALLAQIARGRGDHGAALQHWQAAQALQPQHERWPMEAATALRELGRLDEARALLHEVLPRHSRPASVWQALGQVAQYRDDPDEALRCFEQGIAAEPTQPGAYLALANECQRLGHFDRAEAALREGLRRVQPPLRLALALARLERARGRPYEARARLQLLQARHPDDAETALLLAEVLTQLACFDEAAALLDATEARHPQQVYGLALRRGQLARARYDLPEAEAQLMRALQAQPADAGVHQLRALVALMRGDSATAEHHLDTAQGLLTAHPSQRQRAGAPGGLRAMIWRESRTNPFAERALQAAQALPEAERLPAMAAVLADEPTHFGSAVAWLVALQRDGAWARWRPDVGAGAACIPRRIVQFWDAPEIPGDILATMQSWPQANAGFEHQVFNDASADAFVARHGSPRMLRALRRANHPAMRSDIFRLVWLWVQGGVYADADDLCRHGIAPWLAPGLQLLLLQEDIGSIGNNFIAAAPGQPFIKAALDAVVDNVLAKQGDSVWFLSGPGAMTTAFTQHFHAALAQAGLPAGVRVIDTWQMQRQAISMHLPRSYKHDERHWSSARAQLQSVFRPAQAAGPQATEPIGRRGPASPPLRFLQRVVDNDRTVFSPASPHSPSLQPPPGALA